MRHHHNIVPPRASHINPHLPEDLVDLHRRERGVEERQLGEAPVEAARGVVVAAPAQHDRAAQAHGAAAVHVQRVAEGVCAAQRAQGCQ